MKLVSWNVNGIRAAIKKDFFDSMKDLNADIICIQETKSQDKQADLSEMGYFEYWNSAIKKGYSGTLVLSKIEPLSVTKGIGIEQHDLEGRVLCVEYDKFFLVNVYTPNSQRGLARLEYRMEWEDTFKDYLVNLKNIKPVVMCGDLNVAHNEIDIANPKSNAKNAGFTIEERTKLTALLDIGFIDSYRTLYPQEKDAYTWWSYMREARTRNVGWRIDYFVLSSELETNLKAANIHSDILGSDHCPVSIELEF